MKQIIITLAIAFTVFVSYSQDTTSAKTEIETLQPTFIKAFETIVIDEDTTTYVDSVYFVGYLIQKNRVEFYYYIESFSNGEFITSRRDKEKRVDLSLTRKVTINNVAYKETIAYWLKNIHKYTERNSEKILKGIAIRAYNKYIKNKRR